ncbi:endonuclease/exonuclease/phosphatase family protein [Algoriphagus pacificus]|uniref:Endonuclease/exonuclease/phosphatase family protein n=1 Tax=Algoriphagus pacificus TaxID=2811234 RepID=A0ABS3CMD2_9BACT|nr:endonuclease/exonuclease/phosphatase family protein [Algoriphagus pacificus]MBN7817405.1 endonuclease/exonuclease/phosphatase family protein [Algoriphagus pacificus]
MPIYILRFFSAFFLIATLIPFIRWDHWWIRIFDYPQLQKMIILVLCVSGWIFINSQKTTTEKWIWISCLGIAIGYLFLKVKTFSPLGAKMIESVPYEEESGIHVLVGNVLQFNESYKDAVSLVKETNPDLIFLVETDQKWVDGISAIKEEYPNTILIPKDNTYGMTLYTKLEIVRYEIDYLIDEEIPSIELELKLRNGKVITIYAIHPTPPVPNENPKSTERDAEILIVGKKVKNNPNPSLVIGDLNDVAWSYTTELFLKISEMADPRRGRGLFSTFHAKVPLMRWPLDHIFLSKHFGLGDIKVMPGIGSDHFPISMKAVLTEHDTTEQLEVDSEDKKEAEEKIENGKEENQ